MKDNHYQIEISPSDTLTFGTSCGWESVLQLKPGSPIGSSLLDTIVTLAESTENQPRPIYLGSEIYSEIKEPGFGNSIILVDQICCQDVRWLFALYDDGLWSAVDINWKEETIGIYDPQGIRASVWRDKISTVRSPCCTSFT